MNLNRDRPRPVCGSCKMRKHKCLCKKPASSKTEKEPPNLDKTPGQQRLPVDEHAGSRVAYWMRWMRTTGIREGWMVEPEQNQSSQDQRRAFHGVEGYHSVSERQKTVTDGRSGGKDDRGGAEQPSRLSAESGVAENEVRGPQQLSTFYDRPLHGLEEEQLKENGN